MPEESFGTVQPSVVTSKKIGWVLGIITLVLILILGVLYMWYTSMAPVTMIEDMFWTEDEELTTTEEMANEEIESIETVPEADESNEINVIESDMDDTDMAEFEAEMDAMDAELEAMME